jgi:hypothetical protein
MAVQKNGPAPYAPTQAVVGVIESYRDRNPQTPFTLDVFTRIGITESLAPRTLQALKLLDLVDDGGEPTPALVALKQAPHDEYHARLADVVRAAYADVFAYCDPGTDPPVRVLDAFRQFRPPSMRERMVRLFYGLCEHAEIIEEAPKIESSGTGRPRRPRPERAEPSVSRPAPAAAPADSSPAATQTESRNGATPAALHLALAGLLKLLPPATEPWSRERRDGFVRAWEATLDICHPIQETAENKQ